MNPPVIAWIEDDSDVIYGVVKPLEKEGFVIKQYFTYAQALKSAAEIAQCDLILLDVILPPGETQNSKKNLGLELLRYFREELHFTMPVLVFSIVASSTDVVKPDELKRLNAHMIPKPTSPKDLKAEVMDLLGL